MALNWKRATSKVKCSRITINHTVCLDIERYGIGSEDDALDALKKDTDEVKKILKSHFPTDDYSVRSEHEATEDKWVIEIFIEGNITGGSDDVSQFVTGRLARGKLKAFKQYLFKHMNDYGVAHEEISTSEIPIEQHMRDVSGRGVGNWIVHKSIGGGAVETWTISHTPTGLRLAKLHTQKDCVDLLEYVSRGVFGFTYYNIDRLKERREDIEKLMHRWLEVNKKFSID